MLSSVCFFFTVRCQSPRIWRSVIYRSGKWAWSNPNLRWRKDLRETNRGAPGFKSNNMGQRPYSFRAWGGTGVQQHCASWLFGHTNGSKKLRRCGCHWLWSYCHIAAPFGRRKSVGMGRSKSLSKGARPCGHQWDRLAMPGFQEKPLRGE